MQVIAEGTQLKELENKTLIEGQNILRIYTSEQISDEFIKTVENILSKQGAILNEPITNNAHVLNIDFQSEQSFDVNNIFDDIKDYIAAWQISQEVKKVPWWAWAGGITLIGLMILRNK